MKKFRPAHKLKLLAAIAALFIVSGCTPVSGSVRDYDTLIAANQTKRVDYYCNFEKIVTGTFQQFGDYCQLANNQDYVSYVVSFDIQSTDTYRPYLIQTVNMVSSENTPGQLRYYQEFSGNDFLNLTRYEINDTPPTSFALKNNDSYYIVISKADLLARTKIYPEYSVLSMRYEGQSDPATIGEYTVRYRVAPYVFDKRYTDSESARILGLPEYAAVAGRLSGVQKLQLNNYNSALERFWQHPDNYKYNADYITAMDYAIPQLMMRKRGLPSEVTLRIQPPLVDEGLMNDYLPPYDLQEVLIIYSDGFGSERVLQAFNKDDIAKILVSYEDDALIYSTVVNHESLGIRFVYRAQTPRVKGLRPQTADALGVSYIYSTLGATIETQLNVLRFYELEKLPRTCVDETAFIAGFVSKGFTESDARALLERMNPSAIQTCTPAQKSIGELLVNLQ